MKHIYNTILLLILNSTFNIHNSFSQTPNIWYFGGNAGIDFNSGSPVALTNGALNAYEGCAAICDNTGALLFYTDGITVYNSTHSIMQNGANLNGGGSSNQAAIIVPFPGSPNNYYIFTTTDVCGGPFSYSVVDMTQAAGLGGVTIKNNILLALATEKLTAVKAANGTDYWVVVHESNNNLFYAYNIAAAGVSAPVISPASSVIMGTDCAGGMKLNPQATQLAVTMEGSWTYELFDFDNSTGVISNGIILGPMSNYTYSCEFSPSGHYLYVNVDPSGISLLYQFDVTLGSAAAINASQTIVGATSGFFNFGTLQNAPDGKIYVARENEDSLGVINNPEAQGIACNYVDKGLYLGGQLNHLGLPNFITSYFDITTGIEANSNSNDNFLLFPNPLTSQSKLTFKNTSKEKFLFILFDITGRVAESVSTTNNEIILTKGSKPAGVYLFNLANEKTGERWRGKIIVAE